MNKFAKILDNKKFTITVMVLNVVVILLLVIVLIQKTSQEKLTTDTTPYNVDVTATNDSYLELINNIIKESTFTVDNMEFTFGAEGEYSGFFDKDNTNVNGYFYNLEAKGVDTYLNIYSPDYSRVVNYRIDISKDGNVLLYYDDASQEPLTLTFT